MRITFQQIITTAFLITLALELFAVWRGLYTISDFVFEHTRFSHRLAFCVWVSYHFLYEYYHYYK